MKRGYLMVLFTLLLSILAVSCDEKPNVDDKKPNGGEQKPDVVEEKPELAPFTIHKLEVPAEIADGKGYAWSVKPKARAYVYRLKEEVKGASFIAAPGEYTITVTAEGGKSHEMELVVRKAKNANAAMNKVYDFLPAPAQHVNGRPYMKVGETKDDLMRKLNEEKPEVSLGSFGGYIVFGFDHTVVNVEGLMDLRIGGNAFLSKAISPGGNIFYGSSEPGIVQVAYDANGNGLPDDPWYEIKGSGHDDVEKEPWYSIVKAEGNRLTTIYNYEITYHRPKQEGKKKVGRWEDNQGNSGTYPVEGDTQYYFKYPNWISEDKLTFSGTLLPENGTWHPDTKERDKGKQYPFSYGYVDNLSNRNEKGHLDIDWAVDKDGKPAQLPGIDFVRVYSGIKQIVGWFGGTSTEVDLKKIDDLHLKGERYPTVQPLQ